MKRQQRTSIPCSKGRATVLGLAVVTFASSLTGCELFGGGAVAGGDACVSTRDYFEKTAWPEVLASNCADCHTPGGPAGEEGARFELLPSGYPGFIDTNLERLRSFAKTEYDGTSVLLLKPLGKLDHGGGSRFKVDSDEYKTLVRLVEMVQEGDSCKDTVTVPEFPEAELSGAVGTFRKAALHLAYRLPTPDETESLTTGGEEALPALVDKLLGEEAFFSRLKDVFNDRLLTDRYKNFNSAAVNLLDETMYPQSGEPWDLIEDDELRTKINTAIAREPLELIAYLVRSGRPFTEVVTADFTMMNPFSAPYYNADVAFDDPTNELEFKEAKIQAYVNEALVPMPHAGVLTSPMWLNRFPTTDTNKNRHRARMVLEFFLATDILKVGDRPLDPTAATRYANPTRDDPSCNSCHTIIDPIAGTFQKYDDDDAERYRPDRNWYMEMEAPGFGKEEMTVDESAAAPQWTAARIAADPRFVQAMVRWVYLGLMGRAPLDYPSDTSADNYPALLAAWNAQDSTFRTIGSKFEKAKFDLRVVFREIMLSPYYRAESANTKLASDRAVELAELGTGRLSTPMLLSRKIEAVTGLPWTRGYDQNDQLMTNYHILYGGIDSESVTKRLTSPNGVMASVAWRMANEVSCNSVATDFKRAEADRHLMRFVTLDDMPETASGDEIPAAVERIKQNIQYLHAHVLGEDLEAGDPEIDRTYQLFVETWREGKGFVDDELDTTVGEWMVYQCQARIDLATGEDLPDDQQLRTDPNYTIRAWMAVVTYLLSDYKFLYE